MNQVYLLKLYVEEKKSISDVSAIIGVSKSTIRRALLKMNVLRTQSEGLVLANYKLGKHLLGKKFVRSEEFKARCSKLLKKRWENIAKGEYLNSKGYIEITTRVNRGKLKHRFIMEMHMGRKLNPNEVVHHKNEIKTDNRIENLEIMTRKYHSSHHGKINYKKRILNHKNQFTC